MLTKSECNFFETFCSPIIEVDYVGLESQAADAKVAPELPAKQYLDIRFVVDDENEEAHIFAPALLAVAARGRMTLNSVNSTGRVSTSIDPACCLTIMS
jgi:hypothetical protein